MMPKKHKIKTWLKSFIPSLTPKSKHAASQEVEVQKFESLNYEEAQFTEAQAEIINQLINMYNLIRITKHIDSIEYLTLKEINEVLCQQRLEKLNIMKCLQGGFTIYHPEKEKKIITKQLPYQYYSVRTLLWQISMEFLPVDKKSKWISHFQRKMRAYNNWVKEYIIQSLERKVKAECKKENQSQEIRNQNKRELSGEKKIVREQREKDHPLNFSTTSKWKNYFHDLTLWNKIEKDIKRTRKDCKFFSEEHVFDLSEIPTFLHPHQLTFSSEESKEGTYSDALTRILFIYVKNHPEEGYTQGMNEIVALIFYAFTNKNSQYFRRVSESNSYFVFEMIMSKLPKKHFQKGHQYVNKFMQMMKKVDLRLYEEVEKQNALEMMKIVTLKWFLTGFLTEYPLDDCILLWDGVMTCPESLSIPDYFLYIGLAIVHLNRDRIMQNQPIPQIFSVIKNYNKIEDIIQKTNSLYKLFPKLFC